MIRRAGLLFLMGGGQGLIGWWMVKSGLEKVHAAVISLHFTSFFNVHINKSLYAPKLVIRTKKI